MRNKILQLGIILLAFAGLTIAQRPPQGPPRNGQPPAGDPGRPPQPNPPPGDWIKPHDTNQNGILETEEFKSAADKTFAFLDKDGNGTLEPSEFRRPPRTGGERPMRPEGGQMGEQRPPRGGNDGNRQSPAEGQRDQQRGPQGPPNGPGRQMLPPFFFQDQMQSDSPVTRAQFDEIVYRVFREIDANSDGVISHEEAKTLPKPANQPGPPPGPPEPPNARFIGAELRFGDKLVASQPFSADIVIEDTRRLYDGTTVTKQSKGAIYRDGAGRTRREQPLENVGGFNIVGENSKPQMLVFINDFGAKSQYFLDVNNKIARKSRIGDKDGPHGEKDGPADAKTESLGTKTIEGVSVVGTRSTFEIPTGQLGNEKPIQVVSEKWFSPDLQVVVLTRHLDPLAGEHVFKLVNIRRSEPAADLFTVPTGFRVENQGDRGRDR